MKTQFLAFLSSAVVIGLVALSPTPASAQAQQTINGYLFSKLAAIGSRSETPAYFLQKFDNTEIKIKNDATGPFHDDPTLRAHLGTKVTVVGTVRGNALRYTSVEKCPPSVHECIIQWGR